MLGVIGATHTHIRVCHGIERWRRSRRHQHRTTHLHAARLHGIADEDGCVDVLCEHAALQGQPAGVAVVHRLLGAGHTHDGQHRAEGLLPRQLHVRGDVVQQAGPDQVALSAPGGQEGCA